jgi:hypothetical protein
LYVCFSFRNPFQPKATEKSLSINHNLGLSI